MIAYARKQTPTNWASFWTPHPWNHWEFCLSKEFRFWPWWKQALAATRAGLSTTSQTSDLPCRFCSTPDHSSSTTQICTEGEDISCACSHLQNSNRMTLILGKHLEILITIISVKINFLRHSFTNPAEHLTKEKYKLKNRFPGLSKTCYSLSY